MNTKIKSLTLLLALTTATTQPMMRNIRNLCFIGAAGFTITSLVIGSQKPGFKLFTPKFLPAVAKNHPYLALGATLFGIAYLYKRFFTINPTTQPKPNQPQKKSSSRQQQTQQSSSSSMQSQSQQLQQAVMQFAEKFRNPDTQDINGLRKLITAAEKDGTVVNILSYISVHNPGQLYLKSLLDGASLEAEEIILALYKKYKNQL